MSHLSFYRKWRPQTFDEVIGQDRVTRTLQNAIRTNRVVHAYLFAGHRGTGKTTTARILAKALNCLNGPTPTPDNRCANCMAISGGYSLDVIEIDAASNRGIEEIRELRDRIRLAPTEGRYKVYIIDEAHMLTAEAANALLKTLEEPPAHAVLVLVTTEPHRLPPTILSRCQRFDFRRVSRQDLIGRLRRIVEAEGFAIEPRALEAITTSADGSVRDAESILDQLVSFADGPITRQDVLAVLGLIEEETTLEFGEAVIAHNVGTCLDLVNRVVEEGRDLRHVLRTILAHFRDLLMAKASDRPEELLDTTESRIAALRTQAAKTSPEELLRALNVLAAADTEARWSPQPRLVLEIALIRLCRPEMDPTLEGLRARVQTIETRLGTPAGATPTPSADRPHPVPAPGTGRRREPPGPKAEGGSALHADAPAVAPTNVTVDEADSVVPMIAIEDVRRQWARILDEVKRTKMFCHALLIEGIPLQVDGSTLLVGLRAGYNFHIEHLQQPDNRAIVEGALERVLQRRLRLQCLIQNAAVEPAAPLDPMVTKAVQMFGGQVVEIRRTD